MRTDLTVPSDFTGWKLADVWDLEDELGDARELVSAHIDEQIEFLIGEGWTQKAIAVECSRSQQAISGRMKRLGLEPIAPKPRPRLEEIPELVVPQAGVEGSVEETEVVVGEVEPAPAPVYPERFIDGRAELTNPRSVLLRACEEGLRLQALLDEDGKVEPMSAEDRERLGEACDRLLEIITQVRSSL